MNTLFWILIGFVLNLVVGSMVWAYLDDENQNLLKWYKRCPPNLAWFLQPAVLTAWPVGIWWVRIRKDSHS